MLLTKLTKRDWHHKHHSIIWWLSLAVICKMCESSKTPACGDPLDDISVIALMRDCLDAASGPLLWKLQINHTMPRSKPGQEMNLLAGTLNNIKLVWQQSIHTGLCKQFQVFTTGFIE